MIQAAIDEYDEKSDDLKRFVAELEMEIDQLEEDLEGAYQLIDYLIDRLESNNINTFD